MGIELGHRHRRGVTDSVLWRTWFSLGAGQRIELGFHLYAVLTLVGLSGLLALLILPRLFQDWHPLAYWSVGGAIALLDCLAGLVHELGHAVVATARGRRVYRITLYGLAAAAQRSSNQSRPREQLSIALAGPIGQLLVASVLLVAWSLTPNELQHLRVAMGLPALSNLLMGAANLLPLSPLDGHRAAMAVFSVLTAELVVPTAAQPAATTGATPGLRVPPAG
jgi:Zn-dependent protease